MTDKEKQAIERLNNFKSIKVLYGKIYAMHTEQLEQLQKDIKVVLNLIENQQAELEVYKDIKELADTEIKEILNWKHENKKLKSEIEEKANEIKCLKCLHNTQVEIIDEMVYYLSDFDIDEMCEQCECCIGNGCHADDDVEFKMRCIKDYFRKKVEDD